jgi:hypothetical protein
MVFKTVEHAAPIVQLLVCGSFGTAAGVALALVFPRPRKSIIFAWKTIRNALLARFSPAVA